MATADSWQVSRRSVPIFVLSVAVSALRWAILLAVIVLIAPLALSYFENPKKYLMARYLYDGHDYAMRIMGTRVQNYLPTKIAGKDRVEWVLIAGLLILSVSAGSVRRRAEARSTRRRLRHHVARWKHDMGIKEGSVISQDLENKVRNLQKAKHLDRQELLKIFAETKRKLDTFGREVSFLSIDVVGSTAMKEREEPASVQYDFIEYRKLVENVFRARGVLKSAWTPDGVMACFSTVDDAVQAGKDVIRALVRFNRDIKLMRSEFSIRCGVNSGFVHFDDVTPLEAMSDRVIDIAGHMQKYAEPNTVAVARKVIEPLREVRGFVHTGKVVDGYEVSHWIHSRENL